MFRYRPVDRFAHTLDPRSKLFFQAAFVAGTVLDRSLTGLLLWTCIAGIALWAAGLGLRAGLWQFRYPIAVIAIGIFVAGVTIGDPWFATDDALTSARAGYAISLALLVSGAYLASTPIRETQAAVRWLIPGQVGRVLGVGIGLVARLLPVLWGDLRRLRRARQARLGTQRRWSARIGELGIAMLDRTFTRADRLSLALQSRCLSWNPTLPSLSLSPRDLLVITSGAAVVIVALL